LVLRAEKRKLTALSLIEVVVMTAVVAIVLAAASIGFSGGNEKLDSSSMAKIVHDQLLQSKTRARALGQPVGIAFPGTGTFVAQSFYQAVGVSRMRIEKPRDLASEFPRGYVTWAPVSGETVSDLLALTPYNLDTMTGLVGADPIVVFLPNGQVLVRGLPFDGTNYHLRVGSQPTGSSGGLSGLNNAWDVTIGETGSVTLGRDTSVSPGNGSPPATAALPAPAAAPTARPVITSLGTDPELVDTGSGLALENPGAPINLLAEARSPSGLPLVIRWSTDGGQFSDASEWLPMTYSEDDDLWKSSMLWSLPQVPAATQTVMVEVRDEYGNISASTSVSELLFKTESIFPWEMFFVSRTSSSLVSDVERMNGDGSGRQIIIENETRPPDILVSLNGELIAWQSGDFTLDRQIRISTRDGTPVRTVTFPRDVAGPLAWNPEGTRVLINDVGIDPTTVWALDPTSGSYSVFTTIPDEASLYSASADLRYFAYRHGTNRDEAWVHDISGGETLIYKAPASSSGPVDLQLSAQGNYCGFYDQISAGYRTILARTDGTGHLDLGYGGVAYVSPDETKIAYNSKSAPRGGGVTFTVADINGATLFTDSDMIDYSTVFSRDSKFVVKQARTFADERILTMDLATGEVNEVCTDDGLAKFRINLAVPR
jgi:hypothetical protein